MIIIQVTNEVFIVFLSPKEIFLDTNTFSISIEGQTFIVVKFIFLNFIIAKH